MSDEIVPSNFPRDHVVGFGGLPVAAFEPDGAARVQHGYLVEWFEGNGMPVPEHIRPEGAVDLREVGLADPGSVAWWLELAPREGDVQELLERFVAAVDTTAVTALVVGGPSEDGTEVRDALRVLAGHRASFPRLTALFVGEIDDDQIMSFDPCDVGPLLSAYPDLADFRCCVTGGLEFGLTGHTGLRRLVIYGDTLLPEVVEGVADCDLPALEHLEMWDGEIFVPEQDESEAAAFERLAHSATMPALRHLGLRGFTFIDEIAALLAQGPLLRGLDRLDLTGGSLTESGARFVRDAPAFGALRRLDL